MLQARRIALFLAGAMSTLIFFSGTASAQPGNKLLIDCTATTAGAPYPKLSIWIQPTYANVQFSDPHGNVAIELHDLPTWVEDDIINAFASFTNAEGQPTQITMAMDIAKGIVYVMIADQHGVRYDQYKIDSIRQI